MSHSVLETARRLLVPYEQYGHKWKPVPDHLRRKSHQLQWQNRGTLISSRTSQNKICGCPKRFILDIGRRVFFFFSRKTASTGTNSPNNNLYLIDEIPSVSIVSAQWNSLPSQIELWLEENLQGFGCLFSCDLRCAVLSSEHIGMVTWACSLITPVLEMRSFDASWNCLQPPSNCLFELHWQVSREVVRCSSSFFFSFVLQSR